MKPTNSRLKKKLTRKERTDLWSRLRKEDEVFIDLCNARDEVVRTMGHNDVVKRALILELEKWDTKVDTMFQKEIDKETKNTHGPY